MHVRITRGSFEPSRAEDVLRVTKAVLEAIRQVPGYQRYDGALNAETGRMVAMSWWDSADAANFPREVLGGVLDDVRAAGISLEPPDVYEVVIQS